MSDSKNKKVRRFRRYDHSVVYSKSDSTYSLLNVVGYSELAEVLFLSFLQWPMPLQSFVVERKGGVDASLLSPYSFALTLSILLRV